MSKKFKISVVIATYNRVNSLKNQLHCLLHQAFNKADYEIIVINDGSTDGTHAFLESLKNNEVKVTHYLQNNRGPAAARNLGVLKAEGEIIAFTDDDCLADETWLYQIDAIFKNSNILAIQGKTITDKKEITPMTHQVINEHGDTSIPTCNAAYRKEVFLKVGMFDEGFPFQNEDADLAWRVRELGEVVFSDKVIMIHPPRVDSFLKNARKMKNYISEFMLFHKNPELYKKYRYSSPWRTIYWQIMWKAQTYHFLTRVKYYRKPILMIKGFALSLYWWGDLIGKIPTFVKADHKYKKMYTNR